MINTPARISKDREMINLAISGSAIILGLAWMFSGHAIIVSLVPEANQAIFYYFFSGVIFSLTFVGIYGFVRTILCFTEFMISQDKLDNLMYDNLLQEEHEGVFLKNKQGIYRILSPVSAHILNLENKVVIGLTDFDLHKPGTANKIRHEDQRILDFGETIIWETSKNTGHGEETWLCKKFPCRDNKDRIVGIIGICKNITILKTFQNVNKLQEERYRNLFNKLPYPVLVLDAVSLQPFTFNNAMNQLLAYDKDEFSRMRMSLHVEADDLANFQRAITNILKTGGGEFELSLVTKQRDLVNVSGYAQEIIIDEKTYLHMLLYDNTETKKSTDILISSELKYRSLFEHANDAIIVVSPNTLNIIDANEIAISFLGYMRDDLLLMSIQDLDATPDHSTTQEKIADLEIYNHALYEHLIKNRRGEKLEIEINAHKLNYGSEDVYQFVIRNISARKKTEEALRASENRYRQMFESNMAIKLVIDPDNFSIEDANPAAAEFYGYPIEELRGMDLAQINILSRDKLNTLIQQTREQNLGFYSCPHRLSNGEIRFVEVRDGPMEIEGRQLFYSIIHDVTASKEAENQVLVASKMFDYSTDAVMLINSNNQVVSVNHAFTQITGYQQSEIQNTEPEVILANANSHLLNPSVLNEIEKTSQWKGEIWHRLKNGQSKPLNASINRISDENSEAFSYVAMFSPKYIQLIEQESKIQYLDLTQLPNKSLFIDRLQNAVERSKRNKTRLGIILIDFKNFSEVNHIYGYDVGDTLLKAISKRLQYNTRNSDTISHFSSDDFALLIEDLSEIEQIGIVAQKLLSTLSEDYQTSDKTIELEVSMGISIYPEDGIKSDDLLDRANNALSAAKKFEGSHFELTGAKMNESANLWLQTEASLHTALRQQQFDLHYLPQIDTDTEKLSSIEVLVRWTHPEHGILYPSQFLPGAEKSGFIGAIGLTVIEQALSQLNHWQTTGINIPKLSFNLFMSQIDNDMLEVLTNKCERYNIPSRHISLELSEKEFTNITDDQRIILNRLNKEGFSLCLDDFGSSTTSLNNLLQCNITTIKLDPALIKQSQQSIDGRNLLAGIVALCNTQSIEIIAEAVETEDEYNYLRSLHIAQMQGYHFSKPLSANELENYINDISG